MPEQASGWLIRTEACSSGLGSGERNQEGITSNIHAMIGHSFFGAISSTRLIRRDGMIAKNDACCNTILWKMGKRGRLEFQDFNVSEFPVGYEDALEAVGLHAVEEAVFLQFLLVGLHIIFGFLGWLHSHVDIENNETTKFGNFFHSEGNRVNLVKKIPIIAE